MEKVIGMYTVKLSDTLITIKDNQGELLRARSVKAFDAVESWKATCEKVAEVVKKSKGPRV